MTRSAVSFVSGGQRCAARLHPPVDGGGPTACVVLAHGTTGTMDLGLDRYAQRFADAGLAALTFEYRHFGASEGEPRQLIDIGHQLADWRAAVAFARQLPQVDPARVALWGTSLGGGHVVSVAAGDPSIAAVVAQLPFMGIDTGRSSPRSGWVTLRLFGAALVDAVGGRFGRAPIMVPMLGEPGSVAVFGGAGDYAAVRAMARQAPLWRNAVAARSLLALVRYRPGALAGRLAMPLLVCVADADTAASVPLAIRAAEQAPRGEVRHYPGGHFGAYTGDVFERMVTDQVRFLCDHLAPATG